MKETFSFPVKHFSIVSDDNDLTRYKLQICHDGANPNGSFFETESLDASKDSFKNKPIICAFLKDEDGNVIDFKGHEFKELLEENSEGKLVKKTVYEEQPVGVIPETTSNISVETINSMQWITCEGLIFKEYCGDAVKLIEEGTNGISMEVKVLDGFVNEETGFYHIKKFQFLGVTLLSNMYNPAMGADAKIEIFNNTNIETFASKLNQIIDKANELRGGKEMKREEILAKFSTIKEVEGYQAIVDNSELTEDELEKQLYSLSYNTLYGMIAEELRPITYNGTNWYGELKVRQKYYLWDILQEENIAIVEDNEDNYKNYGIPYEISGDKVTLRQEDKKRYVRGDWRPFQDGQTEIAPNPLFSEIENEAKEEFSAKIEEIKNSFNALETEEYKTLNAKFTELNTEVETLRKFKEDIEVQNKVNELDSVIEKFSELEGVEEFETLKKDKLNFTVEELTKELKIVAFDNKKVIEGKDLKFSKTASPVQIPVEQENDKSTIDSYWEQRYGNIERYKNL